MRPSAELRAAAQTVGNAAIGVGLGLSVLWVSVVVSQFATAEQSAARSTGSASPSVAVAIAAATATSVTTPTLSASAAPSAPVTATPTAPPTAPPATPSPSAVPTATATPSFTVEPYSNGGRRYAALSAPLGFTYVAPIAGLVQVRTYQLIDGEVRVGSFVPSLPFFPYITLESADRRVIFRPGALSVDTEMLIKDGERAERGTPLFKTIGEGASSWRTFYDRRVTANVIASVVALPSGAEVDPVAFLRGG